MPIYSYKCADCEHSFELIRPPDDHTDLPRCIRCESDKVQKELNLIGGYHITGDTHGTVPRKVK